MAATRKKARPAQLTLRRKADHLWSGIMHMAGVCAIGATPRAQAHHVIDGAYLPTRYRLCNGILLSRQNHKLDLQCSPHRGAIGFAIWLREYRPAQYAWAVRMLPNVKRGGQVDYARAIAYLEACRPRIEALVDQGVDLAAADWAIVERVVQSKAPVSKLPIIDEAT